MNMPTSLNARESHLIVVQVITDVHQMLIQKQKLQHVPVRLPVLQAEQQVVQQSVVKAFGFRGRMELVQGEGPLCAC